MKKSTKTIDKLKEKLLCNPKIKMFAFNFPVGTKDIAKLSDILQTNVPEKYFLSEKIQERLLSQLNERESPQAEPETSEVQDNSTHQTKSALL